MASPDSVAEGFIIDTTIIGIEREPILPAFQPVQQWAKATSRLAVKDVIRAQWNGAQVRGAHGAALIDAAPQS
uniref:Uncharacterized protein n=1 Tax=blood disease bacterium R229 TaxID=741978 RepID=G2ZQW5_9RALS|nr:hypothetical protein BDB_140045 [blood disease bacterium R229]